MAVACSARNAAYDPSDGDGSGTGVAATTDGSTTSGGTTLGTGIAEGGSSSGVGEPEHEHLFNATQSRCELPLWCFAWPEIWEPVGVPLAAQECFESSLPPPLWLHQVRVEVAARTADLAPLALRVREWADDGRPGAVLAEVEVPAREVEEGGNQLRPDELGGVLRVDASRFCVGLELDRGGPGSALGISVDEDSLIGGVSFLRMGGQAACSVPELSDLAEIITVPRGNWCLDVEVATAPP